MARLAPIATRRPRQDRALRRMGGGRFARGMAEQAVGLAVLDIIDKAMDVFGQHFGIVDQRGGARVIALRDGVFRLIL